jgi:hypothetical protein
MLVACCSNTTIHAQGLRAAAARAHGPLGGPRAGDNQAGTSRVGRQRGEEDLEAASRYVPLDRLAVSPQCGFATSVLGNALTIDDERAKLRLVAEVARKVWG